MEKFSAGTTLEEIEREVSKSLALALNGTQKNQQLGCLKMFDSILPSDVSKMLNLAKSKYADKTVEIAAIKCIFDIKIRILKVLGAKNGQIQRWVRAALELHKSQTREFLEAIANEIRSKAGHLLPSIVLCNCRKGYLNYYKGLALELEGQHNLKTLC